MDIVLLPSSAGPGPGFQFLSAFVIDGVLAVDAGSLGLWPDLAAQARVRDVVLTHAHMDHVASLPIFLENTYGTEPPATVHGLADTLDAVRRDVFNERVFPDLLGREPEVGPFVRLAPLAPLETRHLPHHAVTLVPVAHKTPTAAVIVDGAAESLVIVTDTGPTDAVWAAVAGRKNLKAIFLEVTFPDRLDWLAEVSGHLTPALFAAELQKAPPGVPVYAIHLKPRYRDAVLADLAAYAFPHVTVAEPGKVYRVG